MKLFYRSLFVASLVALCLGTQVSSQPAVNAQDSTASKKVEKKSSEGRVPAYYAQVGLSQTQRDAIYAAQGKYLAQIEALQKQVAELEGKRDAEVKAVLTADQQKKLVELMDAAKKKAAEQKGKKKPSESESSEASKPAKK